MDHADGVGAVVGHLASLGNQLDVALEHHLLRKRVLDGVDQPLKLSHLGRPSELLVSQALPRFSLREHFDVFKQVVEALHSGLGVLELHVTVLLLEHLGENLGVPEVWLLLFRRLDSVNDFKDGLASVSLDKGCLELLPELVTPLRVFVHLERDAAQAENGQRIHQQWFSQELPLFIEHADFLGAEGEDEGLRLAWLQDGARVVAVEALQVVGPLRHDVVAALHFLPLIGDRRRSMVRHHDYREEKENFVTVRFKLGALRFDQLLFHKVYVPSSCWIVSRGPFMKRKLLSKLSKGPLPD